MKFKSKNNIKELSVRIYNTYWYRRIFLKNTAQKDQLRQLYPGEHPEHLLEQYHCRKIQELLLGLGICLVFLLLGLGRQFWMRERMVVTEHFRPDYLEGASEENWTVRRADGSKKQIGLTVQERQYTQEEAQKLLDQGMEYLDSCILGENTDASHVEYALELPTELPENGIIVQWISDRPDIMSSDGKIREEHQDDRGTVVSLKGILKCQQYEAVYKREFHVFPARTQEEPFWEHVRTALKDTELKSREKAKFTFPKEVDGEPVVFLKKTKNELLILGFLGLLLAVLLYMNRDERLKQETKDRNAQLLADYPELISKLTVLMRAGMTAGGAFRCIIKDYKKRRDRIGQKRYAYEELLITCHEIDNGIPEEQAYERYGKRCGLLPYMRLGGLLAQNLKRGNQHLLGSLNQESREAFEERKRRARKSAEEAGTKMLGPMILMLVVTVLIILYPAFTTFQM